MKWFKHMSDLPRDEGVARYLDKAGKDWLVAYGFLMLLLEAIASRMDPNVGHLVCTATYSITQWERITNCHHNRVMKYLRLCEVIGWVRVEFEEGTCKVSIPRMVEWRDERTRKSGVLPEQVAQSREEQNRSEQRESREEGALSDCLTAKGARFSPPPNFKITESLQEWSTKNYPSVDIQGETEKFLRHEFPTSHIRWDSAWKNWIQNGHEYQQKRNGSSAKPTRREELLKLGKDLGLKSKSEESEEQFCARVEKANQRRIEKHEV